jgi:hypothetical protein
MSLETAPFVSTLIAANPAVGDPLAQGANHLQLIKAALVATFPNLNAAVTVAPADLNAVAATNTLVSAHTTAIAANTTAITANTASIVANAASASTAIGLVNAASTGRNRVLNGTFRVNQRAYVSGATLASGAYGFDRWMAGTSGASVTFSAGAFATPIFIASGSIKQFIEPALIEGGTYTLSWSGTATAKVNGGTSSISPIVVTGLTQGQTGVNVEFLVGTVVGAQFEPGSVATWFDNRSVRCEIDECRRFYRVGSFSFAGYFAVNGAFTQITVADVSDMRIVPVFAPSATTATNWNTFAASTPGASLAIQGTTAIGGYFVVGTYTASADLSS